MPTNDVYSFLEDVKKNTNLYIEKGYIHSVYIRGSYSRNEIQKNVSDIDLIFILIKSEYIKQFKIKLYNLHSDYIIKEELDLMFLTIYDLLSYNTLYTIKYKSILFAGNPNIITFLNNKQDIVKENYPCLNFLYFTRKIDPILKPLSDNIVKINSIKKLMFIMKNIIRSIYELHILLGIVKEITYSCKEQCDLIYKIDDSIIYDKNFKEIIYQTSKNIEYILINGIDFNFKEICNKILNFSAELSIVYKTPNLRKLQDDYEKNFQNMPTLLLKDFII